MAKKRNMTDVEVGLARAMLAKRMKNDAVHFYFNRADRLLSSGRIAQIKDGTYAKEVAAASDDELAAFLDRWDAEHAAIHPKRPQSPTDIEYIEAMFEKRKSTWHVRGGETDVVECKLNYAASAKIIKAIAGLANNRGGHIICGIKDGGSSVEGMSDDKFETLDPAILSANLVSCLDPVPKVTKIGVMIGGKRVGVLHVEKHEHAPVIALKNVGSDIREGGIYFRYVGETRQIKPGELRAIVAEREARAVADFSRRMTRVASGTGATIDLETGEVAGRAGAFVIDKDLLPSIQFIREGDFSEVKGAPTLRLVGDVKPLSAADTEKVHIVRDNITPHAIVENFLLGNRVDQPLQYLHAQAYFQRKWMPIWHYVRQLRIGPDEIVEDLLKLSASMPASRDAVVKRLRGTSSAYKVYTGKPKRMLDAFRPGKIVVPKSEDDLGAFGYALHGLPDDFAKAEEIRPVLLDCIKRDGDRHRTEFYRAACRIDEIMHHQRKDISK